MLAVERMLGGPKKLWFVQTSGHELTAAKERATRYIRRMRQSLAIFNTDGVNRQNMLLPLSGLAGSLERHLQKHRKWGLPGGMPSNISHDLCRPIGWARPAGVYLAKDLARQVGVINNWTTAEERDRAAPLIESYWQAHHYYGAEPYLGELEERLKGFLTESTGYCVAEAAAVGHIGLAENVYPEFFVPGIGIVDKDGLVEYEAFLKRTCQLQPGVFHEPKRDLVLFAHRFFRRSLSHRNSLNQYVLRSFHEAAAAGGVAARLRLDPNLLGHPGSAQNIMELEYWRGPQFDDDISAIPAGVAEHVSGEDDKFFSAVSKTHAWWKHPEERKREETGSYMVRTFEIEELVEDPSPGLAENVFGCRYSHAEYDLEQAAISHFDGAIRAYEGEAYLTRLDRPIDRAGKHADYTKLFRLDGLIRVSTWKSVLTDFYRGNGLIPEYLGAVTESPPQPITDIDTDTLIDAATLPALSAYIGLALSDDPIDPGRHLLMDLKFDEPDPRLSFAEIGRGHLAERMRQWCASRDARLLCAESMTVNLSTIVLARNQPLVTEWMEVAGALADSVQQEAAGGRLSDLSLSVRWVVDGIETTLSIAGIADLVAQLLSESRTIVRPGEVVESWVEPFRDMLRHIAPDLTAPVGWPASTVRYGRIALERDPKVKFMEYFNAPSSS